jgi:hypothetical protein
MKKHIIKEKSLAQAEKERAAAHDKLHGITEFERYLASLKPGDKFELSFKKGINKFFQPGKNYKGTIAGPKGKRGDGEDAIRNALKNDHLTFESSHGEDVLPSITKKDFSNLLKKSKLPCSALDCDNSYVINTGSALAHKATRKSFSESMGIVVPPEIEIEPEPEEVPAAAPLPGDVVEPEPEPSVSPGIKKIVDYSPEDFMGLLIGEYENSQDILKEVYKKAFGDDGEFSWLEEEQYVDFLERFYYIKYVFGTDTVNPQASPSEKEWRAQTRKLYKEEKKLKEWIDLKGARGSLNNSLYDEQGIPWPTEMPAGNTKETTRELQKKIFSNSYLRQMLSDPNKLSISRADEPEPTVAPDEPRPEPPEPGPGIPITRENDFRIMVGQTGDIDPEGCDGPCSPRLKILWDDKNRDKTPDMDGDGTLYYGKNDPLALKTEQAFPLNQLMKKFFGKTFAQYWRDNESDLTAPLKVRRAKSEKVEDAKLFSVKKGDVLVSGSNFWPIHVAFAYEEYYENLKKERSAGLECVLFHPTKELFDETNGDLIKYRSLAAAGGVSTEVFKTMYARAVLPDNVKNVLSKRMAYFGLDRSIAGVATSGQKGSIIKDTVGILDAAVQNPFGNLGDNALKYIFKSMKLNQPKGEQVSDLHLKDLTGKPLWVNYVLGKEGLIDSVSTAQTGRNSDALLMPPAVAVAQYIIGPIQMSAIDTKNDKPITVDLGYAYILPKNWRDGELFTKSEIILAKRLGVRLDLDYKVDLNSGFTNFRGWMDYSNNNPRQIEGIGGLEYEEIPEYEDEPEGIGVPEYEDEPEDIESIPNITPYPEDSESPEEVVDPGEEEGMYISRSFDKKDRRTVRLANGSNINPVFIKGVIRAESSSCGGRAVNANQLYTSKHKSSLKKEYGITDDFFAEVERLRKEKGFKWDRGRNGISYSDHKKSASHFEELWKLNPLAAVYVSAWGTYQIVGWNFVDKIDYLFGDINEFKRIFTEGTEEEQCKASDKLFKYNYTEGKNRYKVKHFNKAARTGDINKYWYKAAELYYGPGPRCKPGKRFKDGSICPEDGMRWEGRYTQVDATKVNALIKAKDTERKWFRGNGVIGILGKKYWLSTFRYALTARKAAESWKKKNKDRLGKAPTLIRPERRPSAEETPPEEDPRIAGYDDEKNMRLYGTNKLKEFDTLDKLKQYESMIGHLTDAYVLVGGLLYGWYAGDTPGEHSGMWLRAEVEDRGPGEEPRRRWVDEKGPEEVAPEEEPVIDPERPKISKEDSKVLILGHSQSGRLRLGGAQRDSLKSRGIKAEIYTEGDTDTALSKYITKVKKSFNYTHAILHLNGNNWKKVPERESRGDIEDYPVPLEEEAKKKIVDYVIDTLEIPEENIWIIVPPFNTEYDGKGNPKKARNYRRRKESSKRVIEWFKLNYPKAKAPDMIEGGKDLFISDQYHTTKKNKIIQQKAEEIAIQIEKTVGDLPEAEGVNPDLLKKYEYLYKRAAAQDVELGMAPEPSEMVAWAEDDPDTLPHWINNLEEKLKLKEGKFSINSIFKLIAEVMEERNEKVVAD